jgi:hypothetical protein
MINLVFWREMCKHEIPWTQKLEAVGLKVRNFALNNYTKNNRILIIVDASHFSNQLHKSHLKILIGPNILARKYPPSLESK